MITQTKILMLINVDNKPLLILWKNEQNEAEAAIVRYGLSCLNSFCSYIFNTYSNWLSKEFYIIPYPDYETILNANIDKELDNYDKGLLQLPEAFTLIGEEFLNEYYTEYIESDC